MEGTRERACEGGFAEAMKLFPKNKAEAAGPGRPTPQPVRGMPTRRIGKGTVVDPRDETTTSRDEQGKDQFLTDQPPWPRMDFSAQRGVEQVGGGERCAVNASTVPPPSATVIEVQRNRPSPRPQTSVGRNVPERSVRRQRSLWTDPSERRYCFRTHRTSVCPPGRAVPLSAPGQSDARGARLRSEAAEGSLPASHVHPAQSPVVSSPVFQGVERGPLCFESAQSKRGFPVSSKGPGSGFRGLPGPACTRTKAGARRTGSARTKSTRTASTACASTTAGWRRSASASGASQGLVLLEKVEIFTVFQTFCGFRGTSTRPTSTRTVS